MGESAYQAKCVTLATRQMFRLAAVVMAGVLLWRNQRLDDPWIALVAWITIAVDGYLFMVRSKECA